MIRMRKSIPTTFQCIFPFFAFSDILCFVFFGLKTRITYRLKAYTTIKTKREASSWNKPKVFSLLPTSLLLRICKRANALIESYPSIAFSKEMVSVLSNIPVELSTPFTGSAFFCSINSRLFPHL